MGVADLFHADVRSMLMVVLAFQRYVVKNVTEEMQAAGLWDNTVFVLCGDNGGTFEHGMPVPGSSNYPLRGHKYSWFEGGVKVASFINSPLLPAQVRGTTSNVLLHISDWYATFAVLAGQYLCSIGRHATTGVGLLWSLHEGVAVCFFPL